MKIKKSLLKKCSKIKLVVTDVDGVLTDGGMYYTKSGEYMKKFNTKDSMGMELLKTIGIDTVLITRENSIIVKKRSEKIKTKLFMNVLDKKSLLKKICSMYKVKLSEIGYIGDDVNDYEAMKIVGFSATPSDCVSQIYEISDFVCTSSGGSGAFREFADLILTSHKLKNS